ncbi:uncharacterized protein LOC125656724 [Ostrea edulis]|uniref:uncharacterized protein LOC125676809 n=1 Tax=Ostrea edulis TaxID=37623 RepID=UPI0024AFC239|nr:uncharacterized protein LOC125676809 [Ostrea edulis]XP_056001819.1 uncharacterized protein LOC125656724 [Ostrea edulis]
MDGRAVDVVVKKRKPNWSERELIVLSEAVLPRYRMLKAEFSPSIISEKKSELWKVITDEVNAESFINRTVEKVKKKWADMQSLTKKKESERRRAMKLTGGGPPSGIYFKEWENLVLQSLSDVAIEGIDSGVDTADCSMKTSLPTGLIITEIPGCDVRQSALTPDELNSTPIGSGTCIDLSVDVAKGNECRPRVNKKSTKEQKHGEYSPEIQYLSMEKEKMEKLETYRKRKLEIMEEMLKLQQQSTAALERISESLQPGGRSPPFSLSPVIKF